MIPTRGNRKVIDEILAVRSRLRFEMREAELSVRLMEIKSVYKRVSPSSRSYYVTFLLLL